MQRSRSARGLRVVTWRVVVFHIKLSFCLRASNKTYSRACADSSPERETSSLLAKTRRETTPTHRPELPLTCHRGIIRVHHTRRRRKNSSCVISIMSVHQNWLVRSYSQYLPGIIQYQPKLVRWVKIRLASTLTTMKYRTCVSCVA